MNEFKVGDVVVLNSGGPLMTVSAIDVIGGRAACAWIAVSGKAQGASFKPACLRRPTPQDEWERIEANRHLPTYAFRGGTPEGARTFMPAQRTEKIARATLLINRRLWRRALDEECDALVPKWFEDSLRAFLDRLDAC